MRAVGLVGHGTDKFTEIGKRRALTILEYLLAEADAMISGHSPVGGIDIWAEEISLEAGIPLDLKIPTTNAWDPPDGYGFKARNIDIAESATELHVILADSYPPGYRARRFDICYHCARHPERPEHIKSGGCWTGNQALRLGKPATWHIVRNA